MNSDGTEAVSANFGDSNFLHYRKSGFDLVQQHQGTVLTNGFNYPYQVGTNGNDPADAVVDTHDIMENDIFVLASDGLFDNLYE